MKQRKLHGLVLSLNERFPERKVSGLVFRKKILKCGDYVYPDNGMKFSITPKDLDRFVQTFHEMRRDGIEIPIPKDHSLHVEDNTGFVREMRRNSNYLEADIEFLNSKEAENARKGGVSVWIPPHFQNAKRKYLRPIMHVSLTSYPMIPGLGNFDLICAVFTPNGKKRKEGMLSPAMQSVMDALTQYMGWEVPESVTNGEDEQAAAFICGLLIGQDTSTETAPETASTEGVSPTPEATADVPVELVMSAIWGRKAQLENFVRQGRLSPAKEATLRQQFARDNMSSAQLRRTEGTFRGIMLGLGASNTDNGNMYNSMTGSQQRFDNSVWGEVDRRKKASRSLRWDDLEK